MSTALSFISHGSRRVYSYSLQICHDVVTGAKITASDVGALTKLSKVGSDALALLNEFYQIPGLSLLCFQFKCFRDLTKALKMVNHARAWLCPEDDEDPKKRNPFWLNPETSWIKVLSKAFATCRDACVLLKFLDLIDLIDLQKGTELIEKAPLVGAIAFLPLSVIKNVFDIISSTLSIFDEQLKIQKTNKAARVNRRRERKWKRHKELVENVMVKGPGHNKNRLALEEYYESKIQYAEFKLKKLKFSQQCAEIPFKNDFQRHGCVDKFFLNDVNKELNVLLERCRSLASKTLTLENSLDAFLCEEDIEKWREELWVFLDQVEEINQASKSLELNAYFTKNLLDVTRAAQELLDNAEAQLFIYKRIRKEQKNALWEYTKDTAQIKFIEEKKELWTGLKFSMQSGTPESLQSARKLSDKKIQIMEKRERQNFLDKLSAVSALAVRVGKIAVAFFYVASMFGIVPHIAWLTVSLSLLTYLTSYIRYLYFRDKIVTV